MGMKDEDYLALDGRSLQIFLAVMEQGSVTGAASKLGVTSMAVSNSLNRLRSVFNDPLFVRTGGREIVATARASALAEGARSLLEQMRELTCVTGFQPGNAALHVTVGTNDFLRDLLLPEFYRQVAGEAREFSLQTIVDEIPSPMLLRNGTADLLLSPVVQEAPDILHKRLFSDQLRCFYDSDAREGPKTLADFRQAHYIGLNPVEEQRRLPLPDPVSQELEQRVTVRVASYSDMESFMRGSDLLALAPGMLRLGPLAPFASAKLPFNTPSVFMSMLWHKRYERDPAHQWLRFQLEDAANQLVQRLKTIK
ncbi:MAG: LysR family transcriptional regulator [Gammaproteobacteria bacterium]|nr:LysR family transcriptional regulator [Gammaproteobacteria bacterium]MBU1723988.1 LysR family transcriptional regulator [Gammaproteobacteria bacterium]MBU2005539.1 LysR family transcriptional regulator [Gammaproteobacteria bacterium]